MSMSKFFGLIAVSTALCGGCSQETQLETANLQQKGGGWMPNGPDLISARINGQLIQGIRVRRGYIVTVVDEFGGDQYNVVDKTYAGYPVTRVFQAPSPGDGFFHVDYNVKGATHTAERFDISSLRLTFMTPGADKTPVTNFITIKDVETSPAKALNHGLHWAYHSFIDKDGHESAPVSLCVDHDGNDEPLIPMPGVRWNLADGRSIVDGDMTHFACLSAAPGACTTWGYDLWTQKTECPDPKNPASCHPVDNVRVMTACTRAKRDDLCATGVSHTLPGKMINPADNMMISATYVQDAPDLEALISENGASCVIPEHLRHPELFAQDPTCADKIYNHTPRCNFNRWPGYDLIGITVEVLAP